MRCRWVATGAVSVLCDLLGLIGGWVVGTVGPFISTGLVVGIAGGLWMVCDRAPDYLPLVLVMV